jgi:dihydroxy-acid dehydratase
VADAGRLVAGPGARHPRGQVPVLNQLTGTREDLSQEAPGQQVIRPLDRPLKATGGMEIMYGNLAPEGCVIKLAGHDRTRHAGPARVFEHEEAASWPSRTARSSLVMWS